MTVSPDARTPSADVHALSGSSAGPGRPCAPLASVLEMPDPFVPLGAAAAGVVEGLAGRRAAAAHPDAEVIDLAGRVKRLAERHAVGSPAVRALLAKVRAENPSPSTYAPSEIWDPYILRLRAAEKSSGLSYLWKVRGRMVRRLCRWIDRLAAMEPQTMAGLAAKAAASLAVRDGDEHDHRSEAVTRAVHHDAVRLGQSAFDDPSAAIVDLLDARHPDAELERLGRAWAKSCARYERACAEDDAHDNAIDLIAPPRSLIARSDDYLETLCVPDGAGIGNPFGMPWYGRPTKIAIMREMAQRMRPNPRRDEILADHDRWVADVAAENERSGYTAAQAERQAAADENSALRTRICMTPARTQRGVDLKIEVILWLLDGLDNFADEMSKDLIEEPQFSEGLALSLVLDLARQRSVSEQPLRAASAA